MSDLINGREMLKRYQEDLCYGIACKECSMCMEDGGCRVEEWIDKFPSADTDLSEYSDKLWKNAYERGKTDRPQGEWLDKGRNLWGCSNCGMEIYSESEQDRNEFHKWCSRCGARMKGADDETN